jgi:excisionase family DNA binding protein
MDERNVPGRERQNGAAASERDEGRSSTCRQRGGPPDMPRGPLGRPDGWPPLLTVNEVAAVLRTSRKAVYAMVERAQLPGVTRIGRRLLVRRDDLLFWLDERRAASPGGTRR